MRLYTKEWCQLGLFLISDFYKLFLLSKKMNSSWIHQVMLFITFSVYRLAKIVRDLVDQQY